MSDEPILTPLVVREDDRGSLVETFHHYNLPAGRPWAGQTYVVTSPTRGTVRGLHRHAHLREWFVCLHGRAKVVVVEAGRTEPLVRHWGFVLTATHPSRLEIPPMLWHGWMALDDDTTLLCLGTDVYQRDQPDEQRIAYDTFGADVWEVKPR